MKLKILAQRPHKEDKRRLEQCHGDLGNGGTINLTNRKKIPHFLHRCVVPICFFKVKTRLKCFLFRWTIRFPKGLSNCKDIFFLKWTHINIRKAQKTWDIVFCFHWSNHFFITLQFVTSTWICHSTSHAYLSSRSRSHYNSSKILFIFLQTKRAVCVCGPSTVPSQVFAESDFERQ